MNCEELTKKINEYVNDALSKTPSMTFPRNIVEICNNLGIIVQETYQFDDKISGLIYKEDDKYFILVNALHAPTRKAFTIAHELGHYYLHKNKLDMDAEIVSSIKSKDINLIPAIPRTSQLPDMNKDYYSMEIEANKFAADILMPQQEFLAKCDELNSIEDVAKYFGVSVSAASVRANQLGGWLFL